LDNIDKFRNLVGIHCQFLNIGDRSEKVVKLWGREVKCIYLNHL